MDELVELVVGRLEAQQVAVGAGLAPRGEVLLGSLAEAQRHGEPGLGLDALHDVRHPARFEPVVLARLQHDGAPAPDLGVVGAREDLVGAHAVALDQAVAGAQAAVAAGAHAVVADLDEAAKVDLVADWRRDGSRRPRPRARRAAPGPPRAATRGGRRDSDPRPDSGSEPASPVSDDGRRDQMAAVVSAGSGSANRTVER